MWLMEYRIITKRVYGINLLGTALKNQFTHNSKLKSPAKYQLLIFHLQTFEKYDF